MTKRSIAVPAFAAAVTPMVIASTTATESVVKASESVGSARWPISVATGSFQNMDLPRSPRTRLPAQTRNCFQMGSSSPSAVRICAMFCGVALSPAMMAAGSPGARCSSRNTNIATIAITGSMESRRRAM